MFKLIACLIAATITGILFIIYEAIVAIPLNVITYVRDKIIPAYKEIFQNYKDGS